MAPEPCPAMAPGHCQGPAMMPEPKLVALHMED